MGKGFNRDIIKEKIQRPNNDMKRSSSSLVIKEIQIKTISRYYYMPTKLQKLFNLTISSTGKAVEQLEISYILV